MQRRFARGRSGALRRALGRGISPLLVRSNELLSVGQFAEAADGLEQVARAAETRGGRHAARLYLEAGRARVMAAQTARGLTVLQHGLGLLAASQFSHRLARSASRIIAELKDRGLQEEAGQIASFTRSLAPDFVAAAPVETARHRPPLPTRFPGCGAPVRPDEVEWLDDVTAEWE